MRKLLITLGIILGTTCATHAQTPVQPAVVTGHVVLPSSNSPIRPQVCVTLQNFKPSVPKIIATGVILNATNFCITPAADGSYSTKLYGNDVISPAGTFWRVDFNQNGGQQSSASYNIVGTSFNLDTATPISSPPPSTSLIFGSHSYVFTQSTPITTWVIPHGFGDKNVQVQCRDSSDHVLIPDTIVLTDNNTTTVTFISAQAGTCIALSAGNTIFTTQVANAVVTNPNSTQTLNTQPMVFTGPVFEKILNTSTVYADQFTGSDASAKIQNAIIALPAAGGVVNARNLTDSGGTGSVVIDAGAKSITLLLGAYTYKFSQIVLETNFVIEGLGEGSTGTTIQSSSASNAPLFTIPQGNNTQAQHVMLRHLSLQGAAGNTTQDCFFLDSSTTTNSGIWYSNLEDVVVQGFYGIGIHLRGRPNDSLANNQFTQFKNVAVFRPSVTAGAALKIEGANSNLTFIGGQYDGFAKDGTVGNENIYVGAYGAGTQNASDISFIDTTVQTANVGVHLNGAIHILFSHMHHEFLNGGYLLTLGGSQNFDITLSDSWFAGTSVGINGGNGYIVNTANSGFGSLSLSVVRNIFGYGATADNFLIGGTSGSGQNITLDDNINFGTLGSDTGTTGITQLLAPATTLDFHRYRNIRMQPSATVITTIKSQLGVGEYLTIKANGSSVFLGSGGNIDLGGITSPLTLLNGDAVTLTREDIFGEWLIVGVSSTLLPAGTSVTASAGGSVGLVPLLFASSNSTMGTGAIGAGTCSTAVTTVVTGGLVTDNILWNYNGDPTAVTGYNGALQITPYMTAGNINFKVCNPTAGSITPGAVTLNWRVFRH